jgi:hypothetical protein
VICQFKKTFLRDLAELPATYRKRIEKGQVSGKVSVNPDRFLPELLTVILLGSKLLNCWALCALRLVP